MKVQFLCVKVVHKPQSRKLAHGHVVSMILSFILYLPGIHISMFLIKDMDLNAISTIFNVVL